MNEYLFAIALVIVFFALIWSYERRLTAAETLLNDLLSGEASIDNVLDVSERRAAAVAAARLAEDLALDWHTCGARKGDLVCTLDVHPNTDLHEDRTRSTQYRSATFRLDDVEEWN